MINRLNNHNIEILNQPYTDPDGRVIPNSVKITFGNLDKSRKLTDIMGYIESNEIYKIIAQGNNINLNYCYVNELSLTEYRHLYSLPKKEVVKIKSICAKNAYFFSHAAIDLSYAHILEGVVNFEGSTFAEGDLLFNTSTIENCKVNFAYTLFNCNIDFANSTFGDGNISFKNAIFTKGNKDFQYANFGNGNVSFANTEFNDGDVSFINCIFGKGDVSFKIARFGTGKKDFHYTKFTNCDVSFERTEFGNGKVDFRTVEFNEGKINFNRATFGNGGITFEASELKSGKFNFKKVITGSGGFDFSMAEFNNAEAYFDGSEFGDGTLSFYSSKFAKLSLHSCHLDHYIDLRVAKANTIDLSDTIVRDIIDFVPFEFDIKVKTLELAGMRLIGRIYLNWDDNNVLNLIQSQQNTSEHQKAEQFNILKQNFNNTGQYNNEDSAYIYFKRYEMQALVKSKVKKNKLSIIWVYPTYLFKIIVFDRMGLYATSPGRVLISVVICWFIFGLGYFSIFKLELGATTSSVGNPDQISVLMQSFYHSAVTFFTIGYGDVYPQGLSRILSAIEGFTGVFMMSYFTVAFVRKILR